MSTGFGIMSTHWLVKDRLREVRDALTFAAICEFEERHHRERKAPKRRLSKKGRKRS